MGDGAKDDPAQCKEPKFLAKKGWVKKAPGRLLASYKDRYIHVEKTEVVVYEHEDLQNCLERLDLENYDACREIKSPFKRKHRLILIRSPKSGNKIHDVKFQVQTAEEKEAWIKALKDCINRAKNKVFDEVKVDESSNLEHITRTRPKGNRNRRPPTRIHMKESATPDGIPGLDLDHEDTLTANGVHNASADSTQISKEAIQVTSPSSSDATEKQSRPIADEENKPEPDVSPKKKVIKPPMPPIKEVQWDKPSTDEPDNNDVSMKKVLKPPMPPSKEAKPGVPCVDEPPENSNAGGVPEENTDATKKTIPPPTPSSKPIARSNPLAETSQSEPDSNPPSPPSKEKKPSYQAVDPHPEVLGTSDDKGKEPISEEAGCSVKDDEFKSTEEGIPENESGQTISSHKNKSSENELQIPTEPLKKGPTPPLTPKKKSKDVVQPDTQKVETLTPMHGTEGQDPTAASDTSASSHTEEVQHKSEVCPIVVSLTEPVGDDLNLSPLLSHLHGEKKKKEEEKSVDSGQHSDDDNDGSGSEDMLAASTAVLRGSHACLDVLDTSEDSIQVNIEQQKPIPPLKPSAKARSASIGDLLSDSAFCVEVKQHSRAVARKEGVPNDEVMMLEAEVSMEMEKTSKLLSRVSQSQRRADGEGLPEDLLAKAMEKLKKADDVLKEVKKLKPPNNSSNRKSW